ncbi:hypothetical protein LV779_12300 [Streptomyces thinghirensis]|nr:hypothetical protein [Streptomyces thinghirensis]
MRGVSPSTRHLATAAKVEVGDELPLRLPDGIEARSKVVASTAATGLGGGDQDRASPPATSRRASTAPCWWPRRRREACRRTSAHAPTPRRAPSSRTWTANSAPGPTT